MNTDNYTKCTLYIDYTTSGCNDGNVDIHYNMIHLVTKDKECKLHCDNIFTADNAAIAVIQFLKDIDNKILFYVMGRSTVMAFTLLLKGFELPNNCKPLQFNLIKCLL
jgi:hypothetical protein